MCSMLKPQVAYRNSHSVVCLNGVTLSSLSVTHHTLTAKLTFPSVRALKKLFLVEELITITFNMERCGGLFNGKYLCIMNMTGYLSMRAPPLHVLHFVPYCCGADLQMVRFLDGLLKITYDLWQPSLSGLDMAQCYGTGLSCTYITTKDL